MIEFKGTYVSQFTPDAVSVLVQYDGVVLHIWHLPEPFHRLVSSDEFRVTKSRIAGNRHTIKLPNGGHVKTDDCQAFERLRQTQKRNAGREAGAIPPNWVMALIGAMSVGVGLLWLASKGLLF